jgi:hypothetical protein
MFREMVVKDSSCAKVDAKPMPHRRIGQIAPHPTMESAHRIRVHLQGTDRSPITDLFDVETD